MRRESVAEMWCRGFIIWWREREVEAVGERVSEVRIVRVFLESGL